MGIIRMYLSEKGIWRYEFKRLGQIYWASLHTRNEDVARAKYEEIMARINPAPRHDGKKKHIP